MNRREAIVTGLCALALKPLTALAGVFKSEKAKVVVRHGERVRQTIERGTTIYIKPYDAPRGLQYWMYGDPPEYVDISEPKHVAMKADFWCPVTTGEGATVMEFKT